MEIWLISAKLYAFFEHFAITIMSSNSKIFNCHHNECMITIIKDY